MESPVLREITAHVVRGHQVASGRGGDPRFPGGTLAMQMPFFRERGLDISGYYPGTLNVGISPYRYRVMQPRLTYRAVRWHPTAPAEDFSFFDVMASAGSDEWVNGLIYYPHPETKPEHFQHADVLELLLPYVKGIALSASLRLMVPPDQMLFELT